MRLSSGTGRRSAEPSGLPVPYPVGVRLVVARCSVDYTGRLTAHLPLAPRLLIVKADGSVLVHSDGGSYKPLNWMTPPCTLRSTRRDDDEIEADPDSDWIEQWDVTHDKTGDKLRVRLHEILEDSSHELGEDPGLQKDGVEAHLQALLAENIDTLGEGWSLVRREYGTAIGPVDIMARDADGAAVAIEIKRRGEIDGVEQLTRYLELLNRDPLLAPVRGVFAAQAIKPQARVLAEDRGIDCVTLDYDALRGIDDVDSRLF
ncbi:endonuclease NucS [Brachybacterium alimentarium]